jgi:hypothetical protein
MSKRILVALLFECKEKQSFKSAKLTKDIWLSIQPRTEICPGLVGHYGMAARRPRRLLDPCKTHLQVLRQKKGGDPSLSIKAIKLHAVLPKVQQVQTEWGSPHREALTQRQET